MERQTLASCNQDSLPVKKEEDAGSPESCCCDANMRLFWLAREVFDAVCGILVGALAPFSPTQRALQLIRSRGRLQEMGSKAKEFAELVPKLRGSAGSKVLWAGGTSVVHAALLLGNQVA